jgi:serine/threonine protein kinase
MQPVSLVYQCPIGRGVFGHVERREYASAAGGSGSVLTVAVKTMRVVEKDVGGKSTWITDAQYEAAALRLFSRLQAPSFPHFYGALRMRDEVWLVMEYGRGGPVHVKRLLHPLDGMAAMRAWLFQLVWSLCVGQIQCGFRHLDLKLGNIVEQDAPAEDCHFLMGNYHWQITDRRSYPLLVDFGFATWVTGAGAAAEEEKPHDGWKAYSTYPSPDLLFWPSGEHRGYASDLYALGYTLAELLTRGALTHLRRGEYATAAESALLRDALPLRWRQDVDDDDDAEDEEDDVDEDDTTEQQQHTNATCTATLWSNYWMSVLLLADALDLGLLPEEATLSHVEAPVLATLRLSPAVRRLRQLPNPLRAHFTALRLHEPALVQLLQRLLAWDGHRQAHPAWSALLHSYFAPLRTPATPATPAIVASQRWYECRWHPLPHDHGTSRHEERMCRRWRATEAVVAEGTAHIHATPAEANAAVSTMAALALASQAGIRRDDPPQARPPPAKRRKVAMSTFRIRDLQCTETLI